MVHSFLYIRHDFDCQDIIQEFGIKIGGGGECSVDHGSGLFTKPQFNRHGTGSLPVINQQLFQLWQELLCNVTADKADLLRIADGWPLRFGILDNAQCHLLVGACIHIYGADARACLDAWDGRIFHTVADQPGTAARDQQVYQPFGLHELHRAFMADVVNNIDQFCRQA